VLAIGTRPDCIDESVAKLLASYNERLEVWVELGLQTASDETAKLINRGYMRECFEKAVLLLEKYGIKTVVHLIVGLPGESLESVKMTSEYLSRFKLFGVKIHSVYVMEGTVLSEIYRRGEYTPISQEEYTDAVAYILKNLPPEVVIHRLTGDCPRDMLVAPEWNVRKSETIDLIVKKLG
jgi:radical SAM protein (TIGR01212 family)